MKKTQTSIQVKKEHKWSFWKSSLRRPEWPEAIRDSIIYICVFTFFIVIIGGVFYTLTRPSSVLVDCAGGNWTLLSENLEWGDGMRVVPQNAHCQITASGPAISWLSFIYVVKQPEKKYIPDVRVVEKEVPAKLYSFGNVGTRYVVVDKDKSGLFGKQNITVLVELKQANIILEGVLTYHCSPKVDVTYLANTYDGTIGYFYAGAIKENQTGVCIVSGEKLTENGLQIG
jgi:hypothetical protein